jgi:hypothetical protein
VLEIGCNRERFHAFIRKLFGKDAVEAREIPRARYPARSARPPKALDGQSEPLLRMIGDGQDPAGKIALFRPKAQDKFCRRAPKFPGQRAESSDPSAILAHFDRFRRGKFAQARIEVGGKLHGGIINDVLKSIVRIYISKLETADAHGGLLHVP